MEKNRKPFKEDAEQIIDFLKNRGVAVCKINDEGRRKLLDFEKKMYIVTWERKYINEHEFAKRFDFFNRIVFSKLSIPSSLKKESLLKEKYLGIEYIQIADEFGGKEKFLEKFSEFIKKHPFFDIPALNEKLIRKNYFFEIKDYTDFVEGLRNFEPENKEEKILADFAILLAKSDISLTVLLNNGTVIVDNKFYINGDYFLEYKEKTKKVIKDTGNDLFEGAKKIFKEIARHDFSYNEIISGIDNLKSEYRKICKTDNEYNELAYYLFSSFLRGNAAVMSDNSAPEYLKSFFKSEGFFHFKFNRLLNTVSFLKKHELSKQNLLFFSKENEKIAEFMDKGSPVFSVYEKICKKYPVFKDFLSKIAVTNGYYFYRNRIYRGLLSLPLIKKEHFYLFRNDKKYTVISSEFPYDLILKIFKDNKNRLIPFVRQNSLFLQFSADRLDKILKTFIGGENFDKFLKLANYKENRHFHKLFNIFLRTLEEKELKKIYYFVYKNYKQEDDYNILDYYTVYYLLKRKKQYINGRFEEELKGKNRFDTENLKILDSLFKNIFKEKKLTDLDKKVIIKGMEFIQKIKNSEDVDKNLILEFTESPLENLTLCFLYQEKEKELMLSKINKSSIGRKED